MIYKFFATSLVLILVGCGASTPPKPNTTGPIKTLGGGFLVSDGTLRYGMTYQNVSFIDPTFARAEFESPIPDAAPLKVDIGKLDLSAQIIVQSSRFTKIKNHKNYWVMLYLYSDEAQSELVHEHKDQVQFSLPSELLTQTGIEAL